MRDKFIHKIDKKILLKEKFYVSLGMIIHKSHSSIIKEEFNSFAVQSLLFIRRPDITADLRLYLAFAGLGSARSSKH